MGFSFRRFFEGAALIGSSFIPGLGPTVRGVLLATGLGRAASSAEPSFPRGPEPTGNLIQSANTLNPLPIVYGEARVSGAIAFLDTRNIRGDDEGEGWSPTGDNARADMAIAFALGNRHKRVGESGFAFVGNLFPGSTEPAEFVNPEEAGITAIGDTFFDDRLVWTAKKQVFIGATVVGFLQIGVALLIDPIHEYLGTTVQGADPYLLAPNGPGLPLEGKWRWAHAESEWTVDHHGAGVVYHVYGLRWNSKRLSAVPNISAVLRGRRVRLLNPVEGQIATWQWSENPAECLMDYLLDERSGVATLLDEIREPWFRSTARYCADLVPDPDGTLQKRFTMNGPIDTGRDIKQNVSDILTTFGGVLDWSMGRWYLRYLDTLAPAIMDLNETNIIGDWSWQIAPADEQANLVIAQYAEPTPFDSELEPNFGEPPVSPLREEPEQVQFPSVHAENPYVAEDNGIEVPRTIDLPLTRSAAEAGRRAAEVLLETRADLTVHLRAKEEAAQLALLDVVTITHPRPAWEGKRFSVRRIELNPDQTVGLTLKELTDTFAPIEPPAILELLGQPFEIIHVEGTSTRPPRVWITLPFGRLEDVVFAVVDVPDGTLTHIQDPDFPGSFGNMSYWCACYVAWLNEVWVCNNTGGKRRLYMFNATTLEHKRSRIYDGTGGVGTIPSEIRDIEVHASTQTVLVGTGGGVYKIDAEDDSVIDGPLNSAKNSAFLGDVSGVQNNVMDLIPVGDNVWAVDSLHDYIWYFHPNAFVETTSPGFLDGPLGSLLKGDTGHLIPQGDAVGNKLYMAPGLMLSVRQWEQGLAQTGTLSQGNVEKPGTFNFVERCSTFDQGDLLALSQGSGTPSSPGSTGALVVHRPGGGDTTYPLAFHPGRTVYVPEVNWVAVTSFWASTYLGGPARVIQFVPIGAVPLGAPPGTPPFEPGDPEFEDPDAPPEPGPDDSAADPAEPNSPPVISGTVYCVDAMVETTTDVFEGSVDTGWKITLTSADFPAGTEGVDFEAKDHPHEVVGFAVGANPETAAPAFTVPVPVPEEGKAYQASVFRVSGRFVNTPPACGGPSDTPDQTYDIYVRRHVQGFKPGPVSNKFTGTFEHPGPAGTGSFPPDPGGLNAPTVSTSTPKCVASVTGGSNDRSGTVRVYGEVRFREADNGDDLPIEIVELPLGGTPGVTTPIKTYRPGTVSGRVFVTTPDVFKVVFQHLADDEVPTCGEPHPTEPNVVRDYYARHLTSTTPGPWSSRLRLTYRYPGPAGEQADAGGGHAPTLRAGDPTFSCSGAWGTGVNLPITRRTFMQLVLERDISGGDPFSGVKVYVYIMATGDDPETDPTALIANDPTMNRYPVAKIDSNSVTDIYVGAVVYPTLFQTPPPNCNTSSTLYQFDLWARHESPTKGNSDWFGPHAFAFRLSQDPP